MSDCSKRFADSKQLIEEAVKNEILGRERVIEDPHNDFAMSPEEIKREPDDDEEE